MKRADFIEQYALNEKQIATLERAERLAQSIKLTKKQSDIMSVKLDYETVNDDCTTKSVRADYLHLYVNKSSNVAQIYLKAHETLYILCRRSMFNAECEKYFAETYTVENKNDKIFRVICKDTDLTEFCKFATMSYLRNMTTNATKKEAVKEA